MSFQLRPRLLQRALVALFVALLLPVMSTAHACRVACVFLPAEDSSLAALHAAQGHAVPPHAPQDRSHPSPAKHLKHGGPCHIAAAPALLPEVRHASPSASGPEWTEAVAAGFRSCIWPPPEHRPRA